MNPQDIEPKWWIYSATIRRSLALIFPTVQSALTLFNLNILPEKWDAVASLVSLLVAGYVGGSMFWDRIKASKRSVTVIAPVTFSKPN